MTLTRSAPPTPVILDLATPAAAAAAGQATLDAPARRQGRRPDRPLPPMQPKRPGSVHTDGVPQCRLVLAAADRTKVLADIHTDTHTDTHTGDTRP